MLVSRFGQTTDLMKEVVGLGLATEVREHVQHARVRIAVAGLGWDPVEKLLRRRQRCRPLVTSCACFFAILSKPMKSWH